MVLLVSHLCGHVQLLEGEKRLLTYIVTVLPDVVSHVYSMTHLLSPLHQRLESMYSSVKILRGVGVALPLYSFRRDHDRYCWRKLSSSCALGIHITEWITSRTIFTIQVSNCSLL